MWKKVKIIMIIINVIKTIIDYIENHLDITASDDDEEIRIRRNGV